MYTYWCSYICKYYRTESIDSWILCLSIGMKLDYPWEVTACLVETGIVEIARRVNDEFSGEILVKIRKLPYRSESTSKIIQ